MDSDAIASATGVVHCWWHLRQIAGVANRQTAELASEGDFPTIAVHYYAKAIGDI